MNDSPSVVSGRFRRPEWVAHVLDQEAEPPRAVLLHLPSGRRTALSETATRVWQEVVAAGPDGTDVPTLAATIAPDYGLTGDAIALDISALLVEMTEGEWVEHLEEGGDPWPEAGLPAPSSGP